ncbi:replication factor C large subunit [Halogranum gelatinilyticum]|uniref:Replication factor C large subunit n=1 Tax=Halogranum gelatinilyticum TaxID=660521 RepID=A0A1G9TJI0_9EURY|nr:replication factor C large subunit [Halogranum gelatinilyticum]SDM47772.1 replication factor C large subunit [Halogranum gelatinilyticum]
MDWTEKYRPTTLSEVRGNDKARDAFAKWGRSWDDHRKAVILHGSPGIGKTSAAHALANDMGWDTVELNASDKRTGDVIERFAGRAAMNATLAGSSNKTGDAETDKKQNRQLVILDEADNIHGNYDRGGASAITKLVKKSEQPIVLIANEFYDMSRGLRNACKDIEFRDVSARSIVPVLRDICRREGLEYDSDALQQIAESNGGDLRGAVNDLQAAAEGEEKVTLETIATGSRDQSMGIFEFLDAVLKEQDPQEALQSSYAVDETPDDITKWIEGNITKVYEGEELARAYEFLANADRWLGRVRASQNYSYWRYAGDNAAAGVAAARDGTKGGWTRFGRPQFWAGSNKTADYVAQKIAEESGVSMGTARRDVIPFLAAMTHHCKPRELTVAMAAAYDLDESHVSFITGSGETTNKVESIVEDAQELRAERMEEHSGSAFEGAVRSEEDETDEADGSEDDDGQATLTGGAGGDADAADADTDADDEPEKDDSQSGLNDFF